MIAERNAARMAGTPPRPIHSLPVSGTWPDARSVGLYDVPLRGFLVLAGCLILLVLATRVPLASHYLFNWDSGNYALGLDYYNIAWHQPHPPGYPVYIAAAWLLRFLTGDANSAFVIQSIGGSVIAAVALAGLTWRLAGLPTALVTSAIFVTSPNVWGHGLIASPRLLLATVAAIMAWMAVETRWGKHDFSVLSAVVLALGGGLRPDVLIFFSPLWLFAAVARGPRSVILGMLVGGALVAAWLIPSVVSIGWPAYHESMTGFTTIWSRSTDDASLTGYVNTILGNVGRLIGLVTISLGRATTGLVIVGITMLVDQRFRTTPRWQVLAVWLAPSVLLHVLATVSEPGHILAMLPALTILAAKGAEAVAIGIGWLLRARRYQSAVLAVIALLAIGRNVVVFWSSTDPDTLSLVYVRMVDRSTEAEIALINRYPVDSTLVLSTSRFRQLSYYLPEYHEQERLVSVLGILGRFEDVPPAFVPIPEDVQTVIVLDEDVSATDDPSAVQRQAMASDSKATVIYVQPDDHLLVNHRQVLVVQHGRGCPDPHNTSDGVPHCTTTTRTRTDGTPSGLS